MTDTPETEKDYSYLCRVCGYENENQPWGAKGSKPSYAICPCCGTEFGYDDSTPAGIKAARNRWLNEGCDWFVPELKPIRWSASVQIKKLQGSPWDYKDQEQMA